MSLTKLFYPVAQLLGKLPTKATVDAEISNEKKKAVTSVYHAFLTAGPIPTLLNKLIFCQKRKEKKPILFVSNYDR